MSEWWTYRPEDFLLFSERVYWRLFELHNAAVWPVQVATLLIGAASILLIVRPRPWSRRAIALILAAAWIFVAWAFLWHRYATVNWAVRYAIPLFLAEAVLLTWSGGFRDRLVVAFRNNDWPSSIGLGLFVYALVFHPLVAVIAGRPLASAEVFAIAPDPTAVATLGFVAMSRSTVSAWLVIAVPIAWCALSAATLLALGTWEGWIPLAAVVLAFVAMVLSRREETA